MSTRKIIGYLVMESCEELFEQLLAIEHGDEYPDLGVLVWRDGKEATMFESRASARAAINRTHHYAKAYSEPYFPEKRHCRIVAVSVAGAPR